MTTNTPPKEISSQDPDSWLQKLETKEEIEKWLDSEQDYVSEYMLNVCKSSCDGPTSIAEQTTRIGNLIELIPNDALKNSYMDNVRANWREFRKIYKPQKKERPAPLPRLDNLKNENKSAFFDFGFWEKDGAYYTIERNKEIRICNFTIDVLYFVRSENQPKYVCKFKNIFGKTRIAAVTTDDFTTVGLFRKIVGRLGNYIFEGNDSHLNKIKLKLFHGVPEAEEPKYMGYNNQGNFYTWANGLYYNGIFYPTNKFGIVELEQPIRTLEEFKKLPPECRIKHGDDIHILENSEKFIERYGENLVMQHITRGEVWKLNYYFLPFSTSLKISNYDDDDYEFERRFRHNPPANKVKLLLFERWAKLMVDVYGDNGCVGVVYNCMCVFRDIVFKHNNNYIPMLGFFGPRQKGKSTCARSLNKMFGEGLEDGVNLESGSTSTGVRRYLASMQNAILWLNEYKNSLPDSTLGMIKGISDGSGKLTGRNTGGNETKTYKPRSGVVVSGQDLPTKDPAILSRMIICEFDGTGRDYDAYVELTNLEKEMACTSVTNELMNYRRKVEELYSFTEPRVTELFRNEIKIKLQLEAEDRILLNNSSLLSVYRILAQSGLKFPFTEEQLVKCLLSKVQVQISVQQTSDDVEQYFNVIQGLIEKRELMEGEHYKITKESNGQRKLYLRVVPIHSIYMAAANRAGMAVISSGTATQYLKKHKSYLEYKKDGVTFPGFTSRTSAYVFDYDILLSLGVEFITSLEPI